MAIASLVLGVVALLVCWIPLIGLLSIPLAGLGLAMAGVGFILSILRNGAGLGYVIAGCATNGLALLVQFWFLALLGVLLGVGLPAALDATSASAVRPQPAIAPVGRPSTLAEPAQNTPKRSVAKPEHPPTQPAELAIKEPRASSAAAPDDPRPQRLRPLPSSPEREPLDRTGQYILRGVSRVSLEPIATFRDTEAGKNYYLKVGDRLGRWLITEIDFDGGRVTLRDEESRELLVLVAEGKRG